MKAEYFIGKGSEHIAKAIEGFAKEPPSWQQLLLSEYLKVELNRELIESQKKHQDDSIKQMANLVYATWGLVIATLLVVALAQYR